MTVALEPPDLGGLPQDLSWPIGAGVGAMLSFACGLLVGYARAPREHREAMNEYVVEAAGSLIQQGRRVLTQRFLAVLEVPACYDAAILSWQLETARDVDIVQAVVLNDRRERQIPVQEDRRGTHVKERFVPISAEERARAF